MQTGILPSTVSFQHYIVTLCSLAVATLLIGINIPRMLVLWEVLRKGQDSLLAYCLQQIKVCIGRGTGAGPRENSMGSEDTELEILITRRERNSTLV